MTGRFRAILFDVGGPIEDETGPEARIDAALRAGLLAVGHGVDDAAYAAANDAAVASFAPNAYEAILWRLAPDHAAAITAGLGTRLGEKTSLTLRDGVAALLGELQGSGLKLALAANQPASALALLDRAGVGRHFVGRDLSEAIGLRKPDPRLLLHVSAGIGCAPAECIMVGDRIDNDIAPARLLGMAAVLLRVGRHAAQQPRSWREVPDEDVSDISGLRAALMRLQGA